MNSRIEGISTGVSRIEGLSTPEGLFTAPVFRQHSLEGVSSNVYRQHSVLMPLPPSAINRAKSVPQTQVYLEGVSSAGSAVNRARSVPQPQPYLEGINTSNGTVQSMPSGPSKTYLEGVASAVRRAFAVEAQLQSPQQRVQRSPPPPPPGIGTVNRWSSLPQAKQPEGVSSVNRVASMPSQIEGLGPAGGAAFAAPSVPRARSPPPQIRSAGPPHLPALFNRQAPKSSPPKPSLAFSPQERAAAAVAPSSACANKEMEVAVSTTSVPLEGINTPGRSPLVLPQGMITPGLSSGEAYTNGTQEESKMDGFNQRLAMLGKSAEHAPQLQSSAMGPDPATVHRLASNPAFANSGPNGPPTPRFTPESQQRANSPGKSRNASPAVGTRTAAVAMPPH